MPAVDKALTEAGSKLLNSAGTLTIEVRFPLPTLEPFHFLSACTHQQSSLIERSGFIRTPCSA
jgi:hypothetical protein